MAGGFHKRFLPTIYQFSPLNCSYPPDRPVFLNRPNCPYKNRPREPPEDVRFGLTLHLDADLLEAGRLDRSRTEPYSSRRDWQAADTGGYHTSFNRRIPSPSSQLSVRCSSTPWQPASETLQDSPLFRQSPVTSHQ